MSKKKTEPCVMIRKAALEIISTLPQSDRCAIVMHFLDAVLADDFETHRQQLVNTAPALAGYYKMLVDFHLDCTTNYIAKCEQLAANARKKYEGVQMDANATKCTQMDTKYKYKGKDKDKYIECESAPQKIISDFLSDAHRLWHENLMRTYNLTTEQLQQCITDGVNYCVNTGKAINEGNIKRYTMTACQRVEHLAPMEQRDSEFKAACIALKDGANDELVTEFYYYYRQPSQKESGKMLFETLAGWDISTMFNLYAKRNGKL